MGFVSKTLESKLIGEKIDTNGNLKVQLQPRHGEAIGSHVQEKGKKLQEKKNNYKGT